MSHFRLGLLPYLNAKPLVHFFEQTPRTDVTWISDVPSRLAEYLRAGELDAAIVSSAACFFDDRLVILPAAGVAARGRVESIGLFCQDAPERLRRVALDSSSRTAATLIRILLADCFGAHPEYVRQPPRLPEMLAAADAGLLIGDPALRAIFSPPGPPAGLQILDPGELWMRLTGLPFVYAVWAAREGTDTDRLNALLVEAREAGRPHLDTLADDAAARLDLPVAVCRNYLHNVMVYDLGPGEWEGLRRFHALAIRHGLVSPEAPPLKIIGLS